MVKKRQPMICAPFGAVMLLVSIAACASPASPAAPSATVAAAEAAASLSSAMSAAASTNAGASYAVTLGSRPRATETQVREIGLQLTAIQPAMAEIKVSRIESWSDALCGDIWVADPSIDLVERTKARFEGGDRPPLSDAQAQQVIDAISQTYCHK